MESVGIDLLRKDYTAKTRVSHLPVGCFIKLEKVAKEHILNNIRHALTHANKTLYMRRIANFQLDTGHHLSLQNLQSSTEPELSPIPNQSFCRHWNGTAGLWH